MTFTTPGVLTNASIMSAAATFSAATASFSRTNCCASFRRNRENIRITDRIATPPRGAGDGHFFDTPGTASSRASYRADLRHSMAEDKSLAVAIGAARPANSDSASRNRSTSISFPRFSRRSLPSFAIFPATGGFLEVRQGSPRPSVW
jgi:hypothetical protein